jgi:hypothetical protein
MGTQKACRPKHDAGPAAEAFLQRCSEKNEPLIAMAFGGTYTGARVAQNTRMRLWFDPRQCAAVDRTGPPQEK